MQNNYSTKVESVAVYLFSTFPTKAVRDMTPYKPWCRRMSNVMHLLVFGWIAYAIVEADEHVKMNKKR